MSLQLNHVNYPSWREMNTKAKVPAKLEKLQEMALNVCWSWNPETVNLFKEIDAEFWDKCGGNPVLFLDQKFRYVSILIQTICMT